MNDSDEIIYSRYLADGNNEDLRELMERHKDRLTLFLNGYVHNFHDAEDLMMDAFAEVAAGRTLFSGGSKFKTWLFSIGKKLALAHVRKTTRESRHQVHIEDLTRMNAEDKTIFDQRTTPDIPDEISETPELKLLQEERYRELYLALKKINPDYRQVLTLLYFEDMSVEDVAKVIGKSKKQIYRLTEHGKQALKNILG